MPSWPPKWIHFFENGSNAPEPSQPNIGAGRISVGLCLTHSLTGCLGQSAPAQRSESNTRMRRFMIEYLRTEERSIQEPAHPEHQYDAYVADTVNRRVARVSVNAASSTRGPANADAWPSCPRGT